MIETELKTLLIGTPKPFRDDGTESAIAKQPVEGRIWLGRLGLEGNEVADPVHHGGPDKAVHLYPLEHYSFWRDKYPGLELLDASGAFGENLSCLGLHEKALCLGDVFRVGDATIQCSHARQPCWKLNHRFGQKDVLSTIVKTARSGSYFRVLEEGMVGAGDSIIQESRPLPGWPLERVFKLIIGGVHRGEERALRELADCELLDEGWRKRALALAGG